MTLIFDTETTGKADFNSPPEAKHQPRLVQLGAILLDSDWRVRAEVNLIIRPDGFTISSEVAAIHGITQELAMQYGLNEYEVLTVFSSLLLKTKTLVAHNIAFDAIVIGRAFAEHGMIVSPPPEKFCTMQATTPICKLHGAGSNYKWPKLEEAYWYLFNEKFAMAHDAMADVRACARIYRQLKDPIKHPTALPVDPPPEKAGYDDLTPMPFGKHKGLPMEAVPVDYLHWLWTNGSGISHKGVKQYIQDNLDALKLESKDLIWE